MNPGGPACISKTGNVSRRKNHDANSPKIWIRVHPAMKLEELFTAADYLYELGCVKPGLYLFLMKGSHFFGTNYTSYVGEGMSSELEEVGRFLLPQGKPAKKARDSISPEFMRCSLHCTLK